MMGLFVGGPLGGQRRAVSVPGPVRMVVPYDVPPLVEDSILTPNDIETAIYHPHEYHGPTHVATVYAPGGWTAWDVMMELIQKYPERASK